MKLIRPLILSFAVFSSFLQADEMAFEKLDEVLQPQLGFHAQFQQFTVDANNSQLQEQTGKIWASSGNKLRIEIAAPYDQTIVSNGTILWLYDPDLEQATRENASKALDQSPAILLTGSIEDIKATYDVEIVETTDDAYAVFNLMPLDEASQFNIITIHFLEGLPLDIRVEDIWGQTTLISFGQTNWLDEVNSELFEFTPPEGTDISNQWVD